MAISCDIIKDLIPLYIDDVCSDDAKKAVEKHTASCGKCRKYLDGLSKNALPGKLSKEEIRLEQEPFKKVRVSNIIKMLAAVALTAWLIFAVLMTGQFMVEEIQPLQEFFSPVYHSHIEFDEPSDWVTLSFYKNNAPLETSETIQFDSIFFDRCITNHANNSGALHFRVKDENGNIVLDDVEIREGRFYDGKETFDRKTKYTIEVSGEPGHYVITLS